MIADFAPVTTIDFPGKLAATAFVGGCCFHCPYCHNSTLIHTKGSLDVTDQFYQYLLKRRHLLDGVVISGGEPTLWHKLPGFIASIRKLGLAVKLDTNGVNPTMLTRLLAAQALDYIAMDVKAPLSKYHIFTSDQAAVERVKASVELVLNSSTAYEFRITLHEKIHTLADSQAVGSLLQGARRIAVQGYRYSPSVLNPAYCGRKSCSPDFVNAFAEKLQHYCDEVVVRT